MLSPPLLYTTCKGLAPAGSVSQALSGKSSITSQQVSNNHSRILIRFVQGEAVAGRWKPDRKEKPGSFLCVLNTISNTAKTCCDSCFLRFQLLRVDSSKQILPLPFPSPSCQVIGSTSCRCQSGAFIDPYLASQLFHNLCLQFPAISYPWSWGYYYLIFPSFNILIYKMRIMIHTQWG